jgi:hypothetical protein
LPKSSAWCSRWPGVAAARPLTTRAPCLTGLRSPFAQLRHGRHGCPWREDERCPPGVGPAANPCHRRTFPRCPLPV